MNKIWKYGCRFVVFGIAVWISWYDHRRIELHYYSKKLASWVTVYQLNY